MAKKKSKSKYRGSSKSGQSEASSAASDASSGAQKQSGSSKDDSDLEEETKDKSGKDADFELSETKFLQKIFDSYFDGYCTTKPEEGGSGEVCIQCERSTNPKSVDKPCWYGTTESTGKLLKKYVLDGCLKETKDQDLGDRRSFFMSSFTELLVNSLFYKENPMNDPSTGMPASDIQHLKAIAPQDMYDLYTQSPHSPFRDAFIELLNLIHLVAWKMKHVEKYADEDHTVEKFLNKTKKEIRDKAEYLKIIESKSVLEDMKMLTSNKDEKAEKDACKDEGIKGKISCINLLRQYITEVAFGPFEKVSFHMLIYLLSTTEDILQPERLAKFFEYYDSYFINLFATDDDKRPNFVWLDCLTHNIRLTFKLLWVCARTAAKSPQMPNFCREKFLYPIQVTNQVRRGEEYLHWNDKDLWRRLIFETYTFENPDNEASLDDERYKQYCEKVTPIMMRLVEHSFTDRDLLGNIRWYVWHKGFYKPKNLTMNDSSTIDHIVMPCITQHVLPLEKGLTGKRLTCCVCESNIKGTIYNEITKKLEFAEATYWEKSLVAHCMDYDPGYIPVLRKPFVPCEVSILQREECKKHWSTDEEPPLDVRKWSRSFGIVCSSKCLIENERTKLGKLNRFMNMGRAHLIYDDKYAKMEGPAHSECEAKRDASLARTFIGILEEIDKGTIAEVCAPMQFLKAYDRCRKDSHPLYKTESFEDSLKEFIARFLYVTPNGIKHILISDLVERYPLNGDVLFNLLCHPHTNTAMPKNEGIKLVRGEYLFEKDRAQNTVVIPPEPCRMSTRSDPATLVYATIEEFKEDIFFIDDEKEAACHTKEEIKKRKCTHKEMLTTTLVWCGRWAEMFYKGSTETVPMYDIHSDMTLESCSKWDACDRFEMEFPFNYTDQIGETDRSVQLKGIVPLKKPQLDDMFVMPSCCVFPINNTHVELHYLHYGTKFIITDEKQKLRIRKQLMKNWDALLFIQRLDLMAQTCVGGFILQDVLKQNKMAVIIVNPTKLFNYLMNNQSLSSFLIDFMGFLYSGFDSKFIHRYEANLRAEQDMARWLYLDNLARFRGREQYRFGSLPMEVMRARFEPHKMPDVGFQKEWFMKEGKKQMTFALNNIYKIILKLDVPEWPITTGKTLDLCWPIEYFGHKDSTIQEIIALWRPKWAHYTPGANEAKYYWEKKKTMVNTTLPITECPVQKELIKMACSEGIDIATRIVFLEHIRIKYQPRFDPYIEYPLSHYFMATFQMRGPRDFNWRRLILHFHIRPHNSETRKCLVPGDALFLDIVQMHGPVDIQDLSKVTMLYRKWAYATPYLVPLPTNSTPRSMIEIFGLTEDMPTEYHVVLFDYKKFKSVCKAHIVEKSLYLFHPPYNEIHVQNYPHSVLVRRHWSRENDKHLATEGHNLIWHGQVMVPVPSQIMFFQEKFKKDNGKMIQYLAKGFDTSKMFREIDTFVFQCEQYEEANNCSRNEVPSFFRKHKTLLFYPLVDAGKDKNDNLLTSLGLPKPSCSCCDTEKAFHQYCMTMGSSIDVETVRQDLVGDIFAKHVNEFTIGLFYGKKDLNNLETHGLKKRSNTPQNLTIMTDTEIGAMDYVFVKYSKKLKRFTILDPKHPDHFPFSSSNALAFSSIYLEYPYLKRLQCKLKGPKDDFYGEVNKKDNKISTTMGDLRQVMTYRHEISDEQGLCLMWQKCYLSANEKRHGAMRDVMTKGGNQLFIWPNMEPEKGKEDIFRTFWDQYAITDTVRLDNYNGIWKNIKGKGDMHLFTNYSLYDAYADHEIDHGYHFFLLADMSIEDLTTGYFDLSYIYEYWKQRKIVEMLKTNLIKYMETRTTSIQRYFDRKLSHERGDMGKYNRLMIYRDEKSLLLNHGINMFKEFLDKDLIDPVERKEIGNQIETMNKAGLLYTSPLYKMKKEKIEINYAKLWEQILLAESTKAVEGVLWNKPDEVREKEFLRKKIAKAEIDMHPDNPWKNDTSKESTNEKKGWGFVTEDKNEHLKSMLPKETENRPRKSSIGLSALTSLLSALTNTPITVDSISTDSSSDVIVVQTSSDEPIFPGGITIMGRDIQGMLSNKDSRSSTPDTPKKPLPPPEPPKKPITKADEEKENKKDGGNAKLENRTGFIGPPKPPVPPPKPPVPPPKRLVEPAKVTKKVLSSPSKSELVQQKVTDSPKKSDLSHQKAPNKSFGCEQKEQLKCVLNIATAVENGQVQSSVKDSGNGMMTNGTKKDAKKEMERMKCFGCNKLASDLYKNSLPKTFTGDDNRKTVYPRHCNLCFQRNQHFFCSKKCFASGEKMHSKKCKVAQVEKNKIFVENLHL